MRKFDALEIDADACADALQERTVAESSARRATKLALARWSDKRSYEEMQVAAALRPSCQALWYRLANLDFQAWLQAGGFAQSDHATGTDVVRDPVDPDYFGGD